MWLVHQALQSSYSILVLVSTRNCFPSCNHLTSSAADSVPAGGPGSCGQPRATPQEAVKEEDRTLGWDIQLLCYMYMSFVWEDVREGRCGCRGWRLSALCCRCMLFVWEEGREGVRYMCM